MLKKLTQTDKCRALGEATERRLEAERAARLTPAQQDKRASAIVRKLAKIGGSTIRRAGHGFDLPCSGELYCSVDRDGEVNITLEFGALDEETAAILLQALETRGQ